MSSFEVFSNFTAQSVVLAISMGTVNRVLVIYEQKKIVLKNDLYPVAVGCDLSILRLPEVDVQLLDA